MKKLSLIFVFFFLINFLLITQIHRGHCAQNKDEKLIVFCAGSLTIPFHQLEEIFEKKYPDIDVQIVPAGSRTCAKKITDLKKACDIMASADNSVIEKLLIPDYADWSIIFARNEMVIMFNEKSKFSNEITRDNWYEILLRPGVEFGHSSPDCDPCGYRAVMTWQLAEKYYKIPGLYNKISKNCPNKNIRPKSVDLIALLQAGELDYIYEYRSVAKQHKGQYILLPDEINLKTEKMKKIYKSAQVAVEGKKPGQKIVKIGKPMVYGATILKNAPNRKAAVKFMKMLTGSTGKNIMEKNGQPFVDPPIVTHVSKLIEQIK